MCINIKDNIVNMTICSCRYFAIRKYQRTSTKVEINLLLYVLYDDQHDSVGVSCESKEMRLEQEIYCFV